MKEEKWIERNCGQCWMCKNCTAQYPHKVIDETMYDIEEKVIYLPYCKYMDLQMTYVNKIPCDRYVEKMKE